MTNLPDVCFDDDSKLRVVSPDRFKQASELEQECKTFVAKIKAFKELAGRVSSEMAKAAASVETERLRVIGRRNRIENEAQDAETQKASLQHLIREREAELRRYEVELASLERAEAEQKAQIDRLRLA